METTAVQGTSSSDTERPSEAQLRKDIRYFEGQIARLSCPRSTWEHGALKCYQVLVMQRREMLDAAESGETSSI